MIKLDEEAWEAAEAPRDAMKPRICMPTARGFKKKTFYCAQYEAQDVLLDVDDVDLIHLEPGRGYKFKEAWQRRLLFRDVTRKLIFANPGLHKVRLTKEYDLFLMMCQMEHDFLNISAIEGWQGDVGRAHTLVQVLDSFSSTFRSHICECPGQRGSVV